MSDILAASASDERKIPRIHDLLERLRVVADPRQHRRLLDELSRPKRARAVSFLNQHAFNLAWTDPAFGDDLLRSDVLLRDGVGMAACLRLLARAPGMNLNGTDFIPQLVAAYAGRRVALIGTSEPYLERARQYLCERGADVVCALDGFGDEERYPAAVVESRPDLVILGMGMPKQERIASRLAAAADYPVVIINGGAILDFLAGRFPRAPMWVRRVRMEWLYRLAREPRRLWRRYLLGGAQFLSRVVRLCWGDGPDASAIRMNRAANSNVTTWEMPSMAMDMQPLFAQTDTRLAQLVQRLDVGMGDGGRRIVQFIAARPGEGVSSLAYSYALASAQLRKRRVLLLSNDIDDAEHAACLVDEVGGGDPHPVASAAGEGVTRMRLFSDTHSYQDNYAVLDDNAVWKGLAERFDEIVVDARSPFALATAKHAGGVILVVEAEVTRASLLRKLLDDLAGVNARVLGSVLNKHRSHLPYALHERL
ncbi:MULTISPECIES: WecB/TagA/CpsF family glycosyltransferase [Lysobacter]|uniref:WecB/TagA/CpsF family glycosyltransferase n=1 Tax=Lysobacter TaxID=68 RepID=UPI001F38F2D7|nr:MULTISPECIES: WecB/TagA/CpsF family glycosyltransferase [Lysobacter]UJB20548.1 WecB/TagA/CpsF family glycosyltransferase [Lysobacter capsici]UJQ30338.1 WecB/TagA/CpsF family glycosyltransferase [Lysobacter gummosus]